MYVCFNLAVTLILVMLYVAIPIAVLLGPWEERGYSSLFFYT